MGAVDFPCCPSCSGKCSTPFGIRDGCSSMSVLSSKISNRAQRLSASEMGAVRCRSGCLPDSESAQRLSASEMGAGCVCFLISSSCVVLNAFRHQRWVQAKSRIMYGKALLCAQRLSASEMGAGFGLRPSYQLHQCSTPFGIRDGCSFQVW